MTNREFLTQHVPQRLESLTAETPNRWGKMTGQHMLEHLFGVLVVSRKDLGLPCIVPEEKRAKRQEWIWNEVPFRMGIKAVGVPEEPGPYRFESLEAAKEALMSSVARFYVFYENDPEQKMMHPLFGPLGFEAWEAFHTKHFRHHFSQFGLLEGEWEMLPIGFAEK